MFFFFFEVFVKALLKCTQSIYFFMKNKKIITEFLPDTPYYYVPPTYREGDILILVWIPFVVDFGGSAFALVWM